MQSPESEERCDAAARLILGAKHTCCLTGAGISAESGIPTFRGKDGFWAGQRAEDLATPGAFARDPETVWRFYLWRRRLLVEKRPNPGHIALADIERNACRFTLITQNVDGLHHLAGSQNVIELHGSLWVDRCTKCESRRRLQPEDISDDIPTCPDCDAMMRPGVVWFGELLPTDALASSQQAAAECDVMVVVGTSAVVQPAASLAIWAKSNGAQVIEVNPNETPLSHVADIRINLPAGEILPRIVQSCSR